MSPQLALACTFAATVSLLLDQGSKALVQARLAIARFPGDHFFVSAASRCPQPLFIFCPRFFFAALWFTALACTVGLYAGRGWFHEPVACVALAVAFGAAAGNLLIFCAAARSSISLICAGGPFSIWPMSASFSAWPSPSGAACEEACASDPVLLAWPYDLQLPGHVLSRSHGCALRRRLRCARRRLPARSVYVVTLVLIAIGLFGARLLFVASHWRFYRAELGRIWKGREGGASQPGGLLLTLAVSVPCLAAFHLPLGAYWDVGIFAILVGTIFARVGCLLNGCCSGRATASWFGVRLPITPESGRAAFPRNASRPPALPRCLGWPSPCATPSLFLVRCFFS